LPRKRALRTSATKIRLVVDYDHLEGSDGRGQLPRLAHRSNHRELRTTAFRDALVRPRGHRELIDLVERFFDVLTAT
jgi:hypothetical protein